MIFQAAGESCIPMDVLTTLHVAIDKSGLWQMYRTARQAMRYGQYTVAHRVFSDLAYKVTNVLFFFFFFFFFQLGMCGALEGLVVAMSK
jgi:hypothetical protein